jgi:hypothetical protein
LAAAPPATFFVRKGGGMEELFLLIADLLFEPLIELVGTIVVRFILGNRYV